MGYQPKHGLARLSWRVRAGIVLGAAGLAAAGGLTLAGGASAGTTLGATLSSCGSGWSATWDSSGNLALKAGVATDTSCPDGTFAQADINGAAGHAVPVPANEPSFTTDNYAAGSPRFVLELNNGFTLFSNQNNATSGWLYNSGSGWKGCTTNSPGSGTCTYGAVYDLVGAAGTTVKDAFVVADADQTPGTADTITGLTYGGNTLPSGADVVTITNPGNQTGTEGTAISPLQVQASSTKGDAVTYSATDLPDGLSLNASTGVISGTPTTVNSYPVTLSAKDNGGTEASSVSFVWDVKGATASPPPQPTVIGPGEISTFVNHSGSCLDNAGRLVAFQKVIIWRCGSSGGAHQQFELVTMSGRTTLRTVLGSSVMCVTTPGGTGQLVLGVCSSTAASQAVVKQGSKYVFTGDGNRVMDLSGFNTANGSSVIAYPFNGGKNQQWSLP